MTDEAIDKAAESIVTLVVAMTDDYTYAGQVIEQICDSLREKIPMLDDCGWRKRKLARAGEGE